MSPVQHIYLSPHFDDVVLSCGGQIAQRTLEGKTVIVSTVFAGVPGQKTLSPFARAIHSQPGAPQDSVEGRRKENQDALDILQAAWRPGLYLDCVYRKNAQGKRWLYDSEEAIYGPVAAEESELAMELAQVFASLAPAPTDCVLYASLAIGHHVDHQLVRDAALILHNQDYNVLFYEDYPSVIRDQDSLGFVLAEHETGSWIPEVVAINRAALDRKIVAARQFQSQVRAVFGPSRQVGEDLVGKALTEYAEQIAEATNSDQYAERLWRPVGKIEPGPLQKVDVGPEQEAQTGTVETEPEEPEEPERSITQSPPTFVDRLRGIIGD
ncbi:MAG: PIG-L family deacetylase [Chloroflexota bacterium]|nr:PIG-L family deacetylase [Chloroflexota bacterium]